MKSLLPICAALLLSAAAGAQERGYTFSSDVDFFTRGEVRGDGLANGESGKDLAAFLLQRTAVGLQFSRGILDLRASAQFSTTWGGGSNLSMYEAWAQLTPVKGLQIRAGRQNLSYDDQRIFGSDNWAVTGMSHDVLKIAYEGFGHKAHIFAAYNQNPENIAGGSFYQNGLLPYKTLQGVWYHYDIPKVKVGGSLLFANIGMQGGESAEEASMNYQQVAGVYLSSAQKRWSAEASFYYQFGRHETGLPLQAWMTSVKGGFKPVSALEIRAGYDHLSGDPYFAVPGQGQIGMIQHKVIRGFSSVYGSHHKFYGAMDFFYVQNYLNGFTPGLQNAYLGLCWTYKDKLSMEGAYHFLATSAKLENLKRPLGHEVEFSTTWKIYKDIKLSAGYTFMVGSSTMEALQRTAGKNLLHWGWVMFSVSPRLFTVGKK